MPSPQTEEAGKPLKQGPEEDSSERNDYFLRKDSIHASSQQVRADHVTPAPRPRVEGAMEGRTLALPSGNRFAGDSGQDPNTAGGK